jgi:hypothetical protein
MIDRDLIDNRHMIPHRLTRNRSIRHCNRFAMVIADTIDQGRKLKVYPTNYKHPFFETFSDEIYHPLTRPGIT